MLQLLLGMQVVARHFLSFGIAGLQEGQEVFCSSVVLGRSILLECGGKKQLTTSCATGSGKLLGGCFVHNFVVDSPFLWWSFTAPAPSSFCAGCPHASLAVGLPPLWAATTAALASAAQTDRQPCCLLAFALATVASVRQRHSMPACPMAPACGPVRSCTVL